MATYTIDQGTNTTTNQNAIEPSGNRGSHYNPAAEFLYYVNETTGRIYRQPVNPATVLVPTITQQPSQTNLNFNLNGTAPLDISISDGQLLATNLSQAQVAPLDVTSLSDITPMQLMDSSLQWGQSSSLSNLSSTGLFFAVRIPYKNTPNINDLHYAAVRVYLEQSQTKIQWITYLTSTKPLLLHQLNTDEYPSPRDIVVSEGNAFLYVSGGAPDQGYILQIPRVALGPFPEYSTSPIPLNSQLLHNPQQFVVEGNLVYVIDGDGLYVINTNNGEPVQVISGITDPIGLLFDAVDTTSIVYISTKTGDLYKVDITDFSPPVYDNGNFISASPTIAAIESDKVLSLGTSSGHLTWADTTHSAFYATLPLTNQIVRVDLITNTPTILETDNPIGASPQSVVVFDQYNLSVICDAEIGDIYCGIPVTDVLVMGIGFIPFQYITNSIPPYAPDGPHDGKADTSSAPGYFFSGHPNLPFAGRLTILINHEAAWNSGARFFKVRWRDENNNVSQITTSFVDLLWQTIGGIPGFYPETVNADEDYYSVRDPDDQWYNPYFGFVVDTSGADNGLNHLTVEFFDAARQPLQNGSFERRVFVDVTKSGGLLLDLRLGTDTELPALGTNTAPSSCGVIVYQSKNNRIAIDLKAWRADGLGTYTLSCYRGGTSTFVSTGNVATDDSSLISVVQYSPDHPLRIGHLVGQCNVANVTIVLDVPARAINGFEWVDLGYRAGKSFALALHPVDETPWTDPGGP